MLSLVIPVYRNEEGIADLLAALGQLHAATNGDLEAVFVVDGSPDKSHERLLELLPATNLSAQVLLLSRNFGSFSAIRAGLAHARGDLFAVMAADLQEPIGLIGEFRERLAQGQCDVVVGTRIERADHWLNKAFSAAFWALYRKIVQPEMPPGGIDVFGCNRPFRDHLLELRELNSTLVGLVIWAGFRRQSVPYARQARRRGRSAWSLRKRLNYLLDSVFAFSNLPIRLLSLCGTLGISISIIVSIIVLACKLAGKIEVPGYAATVLAVIFFGGINALGLGLIGEYVWRTFQNTQGRPNYVVLSALTIDKKGRDSHAP